MTDHISIEFENEKEIGYVIDIIEGKARRYLYDLLDDTGDVARYWLRMYVPVETGYLWEHIEKSGPTWVPGGAGGGGHKKVVVGIREGISKHPLYAALGTGLYKSKTGLAYSPGRGFIKPKTHKYMTFYGKSGWVRTKRTKGQRPQRFLYLTFQQTRLYLNTRLHNFGQEMKFSMPSARAISRGPGIGF